MLCHLDLHLSPIPLEPQVLRAVGEYELYLTLFITSSGGW